LDSVLNYQKSIEEQEKQLYSMAMEKVQVEKLSLHNLYLEKSEHLSLYVSTKSTLNTLQQKEVYLFLLDLRIKKQQEKYEKAKNDSEIQHTQMVLATTKRRTLERLREKYLEEYQLVLSNAEQKILDELGIAVYCRQAGN
jgi:flagellar export protein FliJ